MPRLGAVWRLADLACESPDARSGCFSLTAHLPRPRGLSRSVATGIGRMAPSPDWLTAAP